MTRSLSSRSGFSLVETIVAIAVLSVGLLSAAAVLTQGMQILTSSPNDVTANQKAAEAIEAVFAARDSHKLSWAQIRNVHGESGSDNGVFLDGPQPMRVAGDDAVVNTADDGDVETLTYPGQDQRMGTADDTVVALSGYTREVRIRDIPNENGALRSVTVDIRYQTNTGQRAYTLVTYISTYS
jgi:prepilin-type N-terminal cleavage/methylation domain-containing protein